MRNNTSKPASSVVQDMLDSLEVVVRYRSLGTKCPLKGNMLAFVCLALSLHVPLCCGSPNPGDSTRPGQMVQCGPERVGSLAQVGDPTTDYRLLAVLPPWWKQPWRIPRNRTGTASP